MNLRDFKDVLGKPNEGFHKGGINIFGLSHLDMVSLQQF